MGTRTCFGCLISFVGTAATGRVPRPRHGGQERLGAGANGSLEWLEPILPVQAESGTSKHAGEHRLTPPHQGAEVVAS